MWSGSSSSGGKTLENTFLTYMSLFTLYAILMALLHKERTGIGQEVEVPMFESIVAYLLVENMWGHTFDPPMGSTGYARLLSSYRNPFATRDGYISILPYTDKHWQRFFTIAQRPDLIEDERFANLGKRTENIQVLYQIVDEILSTRTTADCLEELETEDIPCGPVNDLEDLFEDNHLKTINFFHFEDHPSEGKIRQIGSRPFFRKPRAKFDFPHPNWGSIAPKYSRKQALQTRKYRT